MGQKGMEATDSSVQSGRLHAEGELVFLGCELCGC